MLVNTCGFLSSAREESEETLRHFDELGKKTILMGCYISVKDDAFLSSLSHLHAVLPFIDYASVEKILSGDTIVSTPKMNVSGIEKLKTGLSGLKEAKLSEYLSKIGGSQLDRKAFIWKGDEVRAYIHAPFGYEYLKIAEGCDNSCTFCIIPKIRGKQTSRQIEDILAEVHTMLESGIKEIEIISQDTTRYGSDINNGDSLLFELLEKIEEIPGDFKYRLFYLYPDTLTLAHLKKLASFKKLLPYFDIPFQHISENVLKRMGRFYDQKQIFEFLDFIRANFPGVFIRTSFIVGFPGETEADFRELQQFIKKQAFESVGIFEYHDEPLAASSKLDGKISHETAIARIGELDGLLHKIYTKKDEEQKGKKQVGYIMDFDKKKVVIRREIRAPEIDEYDEVKLSSVE